MKYTLCLERFYFCFTSEINHMPCCGFTVFIVFLVAQEFLSFLVRVEGLALEFFSLNILFMS